MPYTKKGDTFECTIWSGAVLGVRIGIQNAYDHFDDEYPDVLINLEGEWGLAHLTRAFWKSCPEIRVITNRDGDNILAKSGRALSKISNISEGVIVNGTTNKN